MNTESIQILGTLLVMTSLWVSTKMFMRDLTNAIRDMKEEDSKRIAYCRKVGKLNIEENKK